MERGMLGEVKMIMVDRRRDTPVKGNDFDVIRRRVRQTETRKCVWSSEYDFLAKSYKIESPLQSRS